MNQYLNYSDESLIEVYTTMMDYGGKASDEMLEAINARGGMDNMLSRVAQNSIVPNEIERITNEVYALSSKATDVELVKTLLSSDILSRQELDELIEAKFTQSQAIINDRSINSKTIVGSIAGIAGGSLIGGVLWALSIIFFKGIILYLIIPLYIICYFIIKLFTKQSRSNLVVFIATFIATVLAVLTGFFIMYLTQGYQF
ncbi:MAG: hypothetical protein ABI666_05355 [Ferruginibacter sp.]